MPVEKPAILSTWATDGGTRLEPSAGEKAAGYVVDDQPPARWWNFKFGNLFDWLQYVDDPKGTGAGAAIDGTGGDTNGTGLIGRGGVTNGKGVEGLGSGSGDGVKGTGGTTNGPGVRGTGGATNGTGVQGVGTGVGSGVPGTGGSGGAGVRGTGGTANQVGVAGIGTGTASGVTGTGGNTDGTGVTGLGGAVNSKGVAGTGVGTGPGVVGTSTNGHGVEADSPGTTRSSLLVAAQSALPSVTTIGSVSTQSSDGRLYLSDGTIWRPQKGPTIKAAESATVNGGTAGAQEIAGFRLDIPANVLQIGDVIRMQSIHRVTADVAGAGTIQVGFRIGDQAAAIAARGLFASVALVTAFQDEKLIITADLMILTLGAGGTVGGFFQERISPLANPLSIKIPFGAGVNGRQALDTTVALRMSFSHEWAGAAAGDISEVIMATIDLM